MELDTLIDRNLEKNELRELHLYKLPILKTCDNWAAVKEMGRIDFEGRHANYNGLLATYAGRFYFIGDARIEALAPYRKWDMRKKISIIKEADYKRKRRK